MSSNNSSRSSGDFPITITARDVGIDQTISKLTRFADVIKTLDAQFKASMNSMSAYNNLFTNFGRGFNTLNQGFNQGAQGAQRFGQAMQQNVNTLRQGQTTLNQFMNAQKQTVSTTQQASAAEANLTANTQRMNQAFSQTSATLGRAQGQMMNLNRNAQQTANTMRNATANTRMYDEAIFENNNALNQNNMATEQHTKSTKGSTDAIISNMRHVSALGMGFMMLSNTMSDSGLVQENIKMQQERLAEAHIRTAEALKEHGEASHQYQQAAQSEAKIARGLAFEQREATAQQHNMMFMQAMIASEIMSSAVPALLKYKETIAQVSGAWTKLKGVMTATNITNAFSGLSNVLSSIPGKLRNTGLAAGAVGGAMASAESYTMKATKQMGALSTVQPVVAGGFRSMLLAAGPFIAIIAAVGLAVAAVATDFMGFRTNLEQLGYSIGEAVPVLYPFLEGLQGIGAQLGLTGESAEEAKQHFDNASTGFEHMGELWEMTVDSMQDSNNRMVRELGNTAEVLGTDIAQAAGKLQTQLTATADTWNQFVDALGRGDYKTATDLIISSFEALPGIIFESLRTLGQIVLDAFDGIKKTIGPAVVGIGTELGTRLLDGLKDSWTTLTSWVKTNLVTPIQTAINGIAEGINNIAAFVWDKLGFAQFIIWATTIAKTVGGLIMGIIDWVKPIATDIWNKLQLAGLFDAAYQLGKDVWDQIVKGINDAGAAIQGSLNTAFGQGQDTTTDNNVQQGSVADANKKHKESVQAGQDAVNQRLNEILSEPVTKSSSPSTTNKTTPAPAPAPKQQPQQNIITPSNTGNTTPTPAPTPTPQNQSPYALDQTTAIKTTNTASSGAAKGTHEFIKAQQDAAKSMTPVKTAAEQQSEALDKLQTSFEGAKDKTGEAGQAGIAFLRGQQNINPAILRNQEQLGKMAVAIGSVKSGNDELTNTLEGNALALENNYLQGELQRKGTLEQRKALQDMQMQIETNKGSLTEYAAQVKEGTILGYAFTLGQQEQRKALLDAKVEVANTTGMLQEYALQLESGEAQSVAFAQGQLAIVKQFDDTITETANLNGQFKLLETALGNAEAAQIEFNNGLAKGRVETAQHIIQMDQLRGEYVGTNQVLVEQAQSMNANVDATRLSNDALENWIAVAKRVPDAVQAMIDSFTEFADSAIDSVAEALKKGGDDLDEAFDKIEETLGDNLTGDEKLVIEVQADTQNAVENVKNSFSLAFQWVMNQEVIIGQGGVDMSELQSAVTERLGETMEKVEDQFNESGSIVQKGWSNIMDELKNLNKPENIMNKDAWISTANDIAVNFATMNKSAGEAMTFLTGLGVPANEAAKALENAGFSADEVATATGNAKDPVEKLRQALVGLGGVGAVIQQTFEVNFPVAVSTGVTTSEGYLIGFQGFFGDILGQLINTSTSSFSAIQVNFGTTMGQMINTSSASFTAMAEHPKLFSAAVDEQFGKAADDGINLMTALDSSVSQSFDNMAEYPSLVSEAVDQEFGKAADDGKNLIQALERAVKSSCDAMASAFGKVSDAVDKIGESAQNAESDVDSLKSAVESLPNIDRTITYHIETVGSKPSGAQFGTNMLVDKPQMLLVGEGFGKERVKVSPGTMPFAEDFTREMNHKFEVQRSVTGQPGQPGTNANGTSTNNGTSISTPGQPGANGQPGSNGQPGASGVNNVYAPGYQGVPTNQNNNPDLGGGLGTGMMINSNSSLVAMNNNGKKMIVDGRTGTVIMLNGSSSSSNSNTNTGGSSNSSNNGDIVGQNNNVNVDNDTNNKNNVYAPGSNGIIQSQSNSSQSGSGGNYYYQSQTNNGQTRVNTNIPMTPGMINQSAASSGSVPTSGSFSSDSRSRLLARGDPFGFQTRVVHETPVEVNIDLEGIRIARKILKILTEEMGFGSGYYG